MLGLGFKKRHTS